MFSNYERKMYWRYATRILQQYPEGSPIHRQFLEQIELSLIADPTRSLWQDRARKCAAEKNSDAVREPEAGSDGSILELALHEYRSVSGARPSALRKRIELLQGLFGLDEVSIDLVEFLVLHHQMPCLADLYRLLSDRFGSSCRVLAMILGRRSSLIEKRLDPSAELMRSGLLLESYYGSPDPLVRVRRSIQTALSRPINSEVALRRALLEGSRHTAIEWTDFEHLTADVEILKRLVQGALEQRAVGVNVLIHGPPGTGKTIFAATLARHLEIELYEVATESTLGAHCAPLERAAEARLAQRLLGSSGNAVLLFDEAGSVLEGEGSSSLASLFSGRAGSSEGQTKAYLNEMLERNPVPTLWTCNSITSVDPAILRRFSSIVEFALPPRSIRKQIWVRCLGEQSVEPDATAARLSRYPVSPGVISQAIRTAELSGAGEQVIDHTVRQLGRAVCGMELPPALDDEVCFDWGLINCDADLRGILTTLLRERSSRASICIYGPPGTGKSLWARHLAEQLGMEVLQRRASDLLSAFVGGSEKNIASSFTSAREEGAFLVFDEADSLLRDRTHALHGWQISQVNEMLTWMESHPLPFACTTNLPETLDRAALRRFDLKLKFDYLRPEQARSAFRRFFGMSPPAGQALPEQLTPGDFRVVARRRKLAGAKDAASLVDLLGEECRHKEPPQRPIGFVQGKGR